MNVIGIDLGGTKIALTKYQLPDWKKQEEQLVSTPTSDGIDAVISEIVTIIEDLRDSDTQSVGIGMPGPVHEGCIESFPNIPGAENFCLEKSLENHLKIPVRLENDANAFTIGAWRLSRHRDKQNILGLTLGTGVGGGIIIEGQLYRGRNGAAGEFGHLLLPNGLTVEDSISGTALRKRWKEQFGNDRSGQETVASAESGDQQSRDFLAQVGKDLGTTLANLILALNPQAILIGGSAASALPYYQDSIKSILAEHRFPFSTDIPIEKVSNPDCATLGAALLSQEK